MESYDSEVDSDDSLLARMEGDEDLSSDVSIGSDDSMSEEEAPKQKKQCAPKSILAKFF